MGKTAKHTPGPWRVMNGKPTKTRGIDVFSESYNGKIVASCWFSHLSVYKGEPEARARADAALIASAPDMLAALKEMVTWMPSGFAPQSQDRAMQMAYDAIRKAEGAA